VLTALLILTSFQEPETAPASAPESRRFAFEAELMGRGEFRDHGDLSTADSGSSDRLRLRAAVGLRAHLNAYMSAFAEVGATYGNTEDHATGDLMHLYVDLERAFGTWDMRAGRSEMDLGDGRLVASSRYWQFEPNAFDGLWISEGKEHERVQWQAWLTTAGTGQANVYDDTFAGFYADWTIDKTQALDAYVLLRNQDELNVLEFTVALRYHGLTRNGLDWSVFGAAQDGDQVDDRELWAQAFVLTLEKELEFDNHVGMEFGFATGNDEKPNDFKRFTPVYIDQHRFNGRADIFGFANLVDLALTYWRPLTRSWSWHLDLHNFWRANNSDDAYTAYGLAPYGISSGSSALGTEFDLYAEGRINESLSVDCGAAYFMSGSAMPTDDDQVWFFLGATYGF